MALSTLEFVAKSMSASSVGELCGIGPTSASALEAGSGIRLVEARLVGSPDLVRLLLFLPGHKGRCYTPNTIITGRVFSLPLQRRVDPYRLPLDPARSERPWSTSPQGLGPALRLSSLQKT